MIKTMKTPTFKQWYNENRSSVLLNDEYSQYKYECKDQMGIDYLNFREWMKEKYDYPIENGKI
jgi:hypothetical protein